MSDKSAKTGRNKTFKSSCSKIGRYQATCDWITLKKDEKPAAKIFYTYYQKLDDKKQPIEDRPVCFAFNGGPGAASVFLHMGGLGPKRVVFSEEGGTPAGPSKFVDNENSWLEFTDLVFVDPVGTGFSHFVKGEDKKEKEAKSEVPKESEKEDENQYFAIQKDLESLGEFVQRFLSLYKIWGDPVFIAGESYGGYRVAKLAKQLQESNGITLSGAILISPALEWYFLEKSDYDVLGWANALPSMAVSAHFHGKGKALPSNEPWEKVMPLAEKYCDEKLIPFLAKGSSCTPEERSEVLSELSDLTGLKRSQLDDLHGRVSMDKFARELLKEDKLFLDLYDATIKGHDPFPHRDNYEGPIPCLSNFKRLFSGAMNRFLRKEMELDTEREYVILSLKVNEAWKNDLKKHVFENQVGSSDDLRYAMALNPGLKVYLTHGVYDLVTPYYASNRIANLMNLSPEIKENLTVKHYQGGHMFYSWEGSHQEFYRDMKQFFVQACEAQG